MKRYAHSIFCDDIRSEVNNKVSLIGVFGSLMYVPSFPAMLPKLCAVIAVHTPYDEPFRSVSVTGVMDDNTIFEVDLSEEQLRQMSDAAAPVGDPTGYEAKTMIILSPLHLAAPTLIKVRVMADGKEIRCNGLQISQAPEGVVIV